MSNNKMHWIEYMMFITWVTMLVLVCAYTIYLMVDNNDNESLDELVIKLETLESQNLTVSDMGRLYFECIKYCMDERGSGSNGEYRCLQHCETLENFT